MSVASNYIILELTPSDGKLFLYVQRCANTTTARLPANVHVLTAACPTRSCRQARASTRGHLLLRPRRGVAWCDRRRCDLWQRDGWAAARRAAARRATRSAAARWQRDGATGRSPSPSRFTLTLHPHTSPSHLVQCAAALSPRTLRRAAHAVVRVRRRVRDRPRVDQPAYDGLLLRAVRRMGTRGGPAHIAHAACPRAPRRERPGGPLAICLPRLRERTACRLGLVG